MITFKRIDLDDMPWDRLSDFNGASIFHTRSWMELIADILGMEPVVAAVQSDDQVQGYFMGLITRKLGLKILGSPFTDGNTYFMGFNLMPCVSYHEVLEALPKFAFGELKCHFLMIIDANLKEGEWKGLTYHVRKRKNYALDLKKSETELFSNLDNHSCRHQIRRAIKRGVVIEEATDPGFVDEYYAQYQDVMAKRSLAPDYGLDFVRQMIAHLLPTGNLLLLRARNSEGTCIATSIDLVFNKVAVGWGGASFQRYQYLNPNELIYWNEMKRVKGLGAELLRLGSTAKQFKKKFGAYETYTFLLMRAKNPLLYYPLRVAISINERINDRVRLWRAR
jgi:hypothetical protein